MWNNLSGFVNEFSPVDQCLCPLFKKQRRRFHFWLAKLCTVKVKIFFTVSFFVSFRSLICIFLFMFSTVSVWMMMNTITGDFRHKRVFDRHVLTYLRSFHRYSFIL